MACAFSTGRRIKRMLVVSTILAALPVAAHASGDDRVTVETVRGADGTTRNRYYMTFMTQTFDGAVTKAQMQKAGFARFRKDDESWVRISLGDGALVTQRLGELSARRIDGVTGAQTAVLYNYKTQTMSGNPGLSSFHNQYLRPLLDHSPPLGSDTRWRTEISLPGLGFHIGDARPSTVALSRHYFEYKGHKLVLVDYAIPALDYASTAGIRYAQSGRGVALADPAFGQVYWSGSLYVSKALGAGRPRPYRYARTSFAMDRKGRPLIDVRKIPEVRALLPALYGAPAQAALPFVGAGVEADQLPLQVAAVVDVAAFAIVENSANQLAEGIATAAMGGGGTGQAYGAKVDTAINDFVIPVTSVAAGATTAQNAAAASMSTVTATNVLNDANAEIVSYQKTLAGLEQQAKSLADQLRAAQSTRDLLTQSIANSASAKDSAEFLRATEGYKTELAVVNGQIDNLISRMRANSYARIQIGSRIYAWSQNIAGLEKAVESASPGLAAKLGTLINGIKGASKFFTVLSWAANAAAIEKNRTLLDDFRPERGGELKLNGTYGLNFWAGLENLANLAAIAGDGLSGNRNAVAADLENFVGGRLGDIYMSYLAMSAADQQSEYAQMQYYLTRYKQMEQNKQRTIADINGMIAETDRIGKEISALKAQLGTRTSVSAPDWQDPRIDPATGLPKAAYWAWLKENDPDKLRAMGIDPAAPVGGWPPQTQTTQQTNTDMPRQPDGNPGYPTRDPKTIKKKPKPAAQAAQLDETPATDTAPTAAPTPAPAPARPTPVSAQADAAAKAWALQATNFVLDKFDLGSVSFANDWSPVTFDPVTWTPPVWTPVTWTPPKWVPVTFDAPKPSDLPWTTINDGSQLPATAGNMAYSYASIDGRVAIDLTPYSGWLKTQNQQYVQQLAASAGYPNLASALADATNLMGHAGDPGFQQYAWGAPVADPFVSADIDQSQRLMARAQYTLGGLLLKSSMFTNSTRPMWTGPQQTDPSSPALCGR